MNQEKQPVPKNYRILFIITVISSSLLIIWAFYLISLKTINGDLPILGAIIIWIAYFIHYKIGFANLIAYFKSQG